MIKAYVLVQTEVGAAPAVASEAAGLAGVNQADDVTGPYDVIVSAHATDVEALGQEVIASIQSIAGVTRTITCPVVHF